MAHQAKWAPFKNAAIVVLLAAGLSGLPFKAAAQDYPNRVVQLIVPYPPGGGVDTVGRVIAQKLTDALGQQVIVVNRPGAGSVIGVRDGAKATPDGYTLLMLVTGASLPANTGYNLQKDFAPIGLIASIPIVIMANPSVPVKSMTDIVALAKAKPGTLTIGTPPSPTLNYFGAVQFKNMTGIDVTIVTYKGTGPLTTDLLGDHVKLAFNTLPPAIGNIKAGKLRAIAVAAPSAWRRSRTCRRPPNPACPGSTSCSITGWWRRPERRPLSSCGSTRSCARSCRRRTSRPASSPTVAGRSPRRRKNMPPISSARKESGRR